MIEIDRNQFERLVSEALDQVPLKLLDAVNNLVVLVEDEPPTNEPDLLGLYEGTPLTERDDGWYAGSLPDRVLIFRRPLQRMCINESHLRREIAITIIHELAHHFGISEERLHELGWG